MLNQAKALTWEYLRVCAWGSIAIALMLVLGPLIFNYIFPARSAGFAFTNDHSIHFFVGFQYIAAFAYALPHGLAAEKIPHRLRLTPLSNRYLVTFLLAITAASVAFFSIVTQWLFYLICGVRWPIVTTALSLSVLSMLVMSGMWWIREFRWHRLLIFGSVVTGWVYWLIDHFDRTDLSNPDQQWHSFSAVDAVVMLTTVAVSWFLMLSAFARYRCGDIAGSWLFNEISVPELTTSATPIRLNLSNECPATLTPREALSAMNRDTNRNWSKATIILTGVIMAIWGLFLFRSNAQHRLKGLTELMVLFSGVSGLIAGQNLWATKTYEMRSFTSTLPISDRDFGYALLRGWLKASVMNWSSVVLVFFGLVMLHAVITGVEPFRTEYPGLWLVKNTGRWAIPWLIAGTFALNWLFAGLMGAMVTTGRIAIVTIGWITFQFSFTVILLLSGLGRDGYQWAGQIADALTLGLSVSVGAIGTVLLFTMARRRNLITWRQTNASLLTVLALSTVLLTTLPVSPIWKIVWSCAACLVVAPVAAIPCALQWNRHR